MEDLVVVLFNDKDQPIVPTDKVINEFRKFLGTIAHDYTWAPLIYTNWSEVPHNDEIRIKRDHYYKYDNDEGSRENHPTRVLDSHFKESGLSSSDEDLCDKVMKKERPEWLRLYGMGVCTTSLKRNNVDKPQALAPEFIDAIRVGLGEEMQKDFNAHKEKMDVDLKAKKDKAANIQKELDAQKAVLDA
ncbi:hypothetical protein Cgig2_032326 [Carnegiea gigantea]|uniref:Uncharacterized protein n=1 Tax=Carnegiea gigantea TaxID=171969 RepID=A0A9Q1KJ00_9CARY|nr:hypothetical protein Cgig2_032326 [Carnegiea gigantea]